MGHSLRLHPLLVIFGLLAGGEIYGFPGILVALPLLAAGARGVGVLLRARRARALGARASPSPSRSASRSCRDQPAARAVTVLVRARVGVARRYGDVEALAPTDFELVGGRDGRARRPERRRQVDAARDARRRARADAKASSRRTRAVGWVPQRPAHYARLSARENLELFARLEGVRDARPLRDALLDALLAADASSARPATSRSATASG